MSVRDIVDKFNTWLSFIKSYRQWRKLLCYICKIRDQMDVHSLFKTWECFFIALLVESATIGNRPETWGWFFFFFFFYLKDWCWCFPKPRETNRLRITEVNGAHVEIAIFLHFSVHAFVLRRQTTKKRTRSFFWRTDVDVSQRQGKQIGWGLQK